MRRWRRPFQALAIAHGGADQLAQLLAEIDGKSRGLPSDRLLVDVTPEPMTP